MITVVNINFTHCLNIFLNIIDNIITGRRYFSQQQKQNKTKK